MRSCLLFVAALAALPACTQAADDDGAASSEDALTSVKTLHEGVVDIVAAYRYRVAYMVDTAAGRELRVATVSGGEQTLATLPAGESVDLGESSDEGVFLVRHQPSNGGSALGILDLRAPVATWSDAVPTDVAGRALLRGGTILYTTASATFPEANVFVRTAAGTTRQAPGTAWGDRYRLSADGKLVAYWSNEVLTSFETSTGKATTAAAPGASFGEFDFVNGAVVWANTTSQELLRLDGSGSHSFYRAPVAAADLEWFLRTDGKIVAATHWDDARPDMTQMELVDSTTGEGTFFEPETPSAWPHYQTFRSVVSADRHFLLDWYPTSFDGGTGSVWLHDLASGPKVVSTKLLDGVTVALLRPGHAPLFGMGHTLGARCRFDGDFVRCTKSDADTAQQSFALSPTAVSCRASTSSVDCTNGDGTVADAAVLRGRSVVGDSMFRGRFVFEERDPTTSMQRLSLLDPKTAAKETVVERTCREGSYSVATTAMRLFVSDCTGLHAAR